MSHASNTWARRIDNRVFEQQDEAGRSFQPALLKFLLVELADCEQGNTGLVFPSIALLAEKTLIDRKAVQVYLRELVRRGLINDTGERQGRTKQIPVYRLVGFDPDVAFAKRQIDARQHRNVPAEGVVSEADGKRTEEAAQVSDAQGDLDADTSADWASEETTPPTGSLVAGTAPQEGTIPSKGTIPSSPRNDPFQPSKRPLPRGTEQVLNGVSTSGARAPARGRARATEPELPKPPDLGAIRRWWWSSVLGAFDDEVGTRLPQYRRKQLTDLPRALADRIAHAALPLSERMVALELDRGAGVARRGEAFESMSADARAEASRIVEDYLQACAA
jgi:hypothetical protein